MVKLLIGCMQISRNSSSRYILKMKVFACIGIILCLAVNTYARSVKETEGETVVEGRISLQTTFAKAEENSNVVADFCTPNPCKNGGECLKYSKKCACPSSYTGNYCDLCAVNPCKNAGLCRMEGNVARCYCISPFSGKLCEKDPCFLNPCMNGGHCKFNETSLQCKCGLPYSGRFCEKDPCTENPCQNEGRCFVTGNSFKCLCKAPYAGILCETDPCVWNPCKNGGICKIENEAPKCFCKEPFTGEFCDSRSNFDTYAITLVAVSGLSVIVVILLSCLLCQRYPVVKAN